MKPVVEERNIAKLFSVQGKVVLITGAGGLGGYLARGFAENGARVVVTDVVPGRAQGLQEKGFACRSYQLDQTDKAATEAVVQDIVKAEGRIDALINTAAIAPCHPAEEFPEDELRRVIDINLTAAVLTSQAVGRQMIAQQYGKIVNIGSIAGVMCHSYESMPYECTKAAVHQMTKSLACAWGCYNVNVNAIAPTWIMTPMLDDCPPEYFEAEIPCTSLAACPAWKISSARRYILSQTPPTSSAGMCFWWTAAGAPRARCSAKADVGKRGKKSLPGRLILPFGHGILYKLPVWRAALPVRSAWRIPRTVTGASFWAYHIIIRGENKHGKQTEYHRFRPCA